MTKLTDLNAVDMVQAFEAKSLSPVEVMQAVIERVDARNGDINALAFYRPEEALDHARESESRWLAGAPLGPIDGVPITLKDSIAEASRPMWRGLKANMHLGPVGYDSPVTTRIKDAGGNIFSKTTVPDFCGMGSGMSTAYGMTRNPWNRDYNTGGSSAGSGAAVAAGFGPLSVGSDIGGSVRVPAMHGGLVGIKPTQGRIPHLPASTTRSAGPMTRTVADTALLMNVIAQPARLDLHSLPADGVDYLARLKDFDPNGKRILLVMDQEEGIPVEPQIEAAVRAAARMFEDAGAIVEEGPSLSDQVFMEAVYTVLQQRGYAEYKKVADVPGGTFDYFREWYSGSDSISGADVALALEIIDKAKGAVALRLEPYDYVLSPTGAQSGFPVDAFEANADGSHRQNYFTPLWNQTGHPALNICCGFDDRNGMPLGLHIVGHRFDDLGILQMAAAYEAMRGFAMNWPD